VQRWVLARLRQRRFFSLAELNAAIGELIAVLNNRPMRHLGSSRRALFEANERGALLPLPADAYVYAEWRRCRAGIDYHVELYGHWYSVPSRLVREAIEARITEQTVELFHRGTRIACHIRSPLRGRHTTIPEHMPSSHRRYADWTPTRLMNEATIIGPATAALVEQILHAKPHPEQGFRACLGILRLVRAWGAERVEAACLRGIDIGAHSYSSIVSILRNNLDRAYRPQPVPDEPPVQHGNIRGGRYYH
jgi:transposase